MMTTETTLFDKFLWRTLHERNTKEAIAEKIAEGNSSNPTKGKRKTLKSALQIMVLFNYIKAREKSRQFIRDK